MGLDPEAPVPASDSVVPLCNRHELTTIEEATVAEIHQVGPDQDGFFRFYSDEVLPQL